MNTEIIKILIEKYYEGKTTLAEERKLKAYFASGNIDDELKRYAPIFKFIQLESTRKPPPSLEQKLETIFDAPLTRQPLFGNKFTYYISGIAAAVALLVTIFLTINNEPKSQPALTESEREEVLLAYNQTKATLAYIANNFAKGTQPLEKIEKLETGQEAIQSLGKFDRKLNQMSTNMQTFSSQIENLHQLSKFNIINN